MTEVRVAITTVGNAELAATVARLLVEERLAACVQIVPGVQSFYRWSNPTDQIPASQVQQDTEWLLLVKTQQSRLAELERRLQQLHSYELPEFLVLVPAGGSQAYLDWVTSATALLS